MTLLDKIQHWLLEILGTIILIVLSARFIWDITYGIVTFGIEWYLAGFVIGLVFIGRKGLAELLLRIRGN